MAHTASVGSVKRTVNVIGKRLGVKKFGGEYVKAGAIIIRQRGSKFYPGLNTDIGRDFTIFDKTSGFVSFRRMSGYKRTQKYIDVVESTAQVKNADLVKKPVVETVEVNAKTAKSKKTVAKKK
jgi:large subunit ribosomal protein L27